MMTISRLCCVVVAALAMTGSPGCGELDGAKAAGAVSQVNQDVTQCELDCLSGAVLTCTTVPCSITATTLTCNGATTTCPPCVPTTCEANGATCGTISDGCGGTLSCGTCGSGQQCLANTCGCDAGKVDCCGNGVCTSPALCPKISCD